MGPTIISLQETMEDIDKNGDGFIDLEEYIGEMSLCPFLASSSLEFAAGMCCPIPSPLGILSLLTS